MLSFSTIEAGRNKQHSIDSPLEIRTRAIPLQNVRVKGDVYQQYCPVNLFTVLDDWINYLLNPGIYTGASVKVALNHVLDKF